jgi:hypothetical protein
MHCEILNRSLANWQIFDWLDETLGLSGGSEPPQAGQLGSGGGSMGG